MKKTVTLFYCNFCAKNQHEVAELVAGPNDVAICNECVDACVKVLAEKRTPIADTLSGGSAT